MDRTEVVSAQQDDRNSILKHTYDLVNALSWPKSKERPSSIIMITLSIRLNSIHYGPYSSSMHEVLHTFIWNTVSLLAPMIRKPGTMASHSVNTENCGFAF